jgi:hypothetical protein
MVATIILKDSILETLFNGLNTRKTLRDFKSRAETNFCKRLTNIIKKSIWFQLFDKYEFLGFINLYLFKSYKFWK